jgi:hypothetical protein
MSNLHLSVAMRNAGLDAMLALLDAGAGAGTVTFYAGAVPTTVATAISGQTLLGTAILHDPAFGSAVGGVATANTITDDPAADASGTPAFARFRDSNGNSVMDATIGVVGSGAAVIVPTATIVAGLPLGISAINITLSSGE